MQMNKSLKMTTRTPLLIVGKEVCQFTLRIIVVRFKIQNVMELECLK